MYINFSLIPLLLRVLYEALATPENCFNRFKNVCTQFYLKKKRQEEAATVTQFSFSLF